MLPQKKDNSFLSVPVSRVGSSARLNQLSVPGTPRATSRPTTPGAYVASSLNPARNPPVTINNIQSKLTGQEITQFEKLPIVESLRKFEVLFGELSSSITSFKEEDFTSTVDELIDVSKEISEDLNKLNVHHSLGQKIQTLSQVNDALEAQSRYILTQLIACRAQLKSLPRTSAARNNNVQKLHNVDVEVLLDYAMKLAKFSKSPATVSSQFIHPNNYIWPAEDSLRRGMLALASIKPNELIEVELGTKSEVTDFAPRADVSHSDIEMEDVHKQDDLQSTQKHNIGKTNSAPKVSNETKQSTEATTSNLDLDLFDPEDDSE